MKSFRFLSVVFLIVCIHSVGLAGTGNQKNENRSQNFGVLPYTTPDSPDMPADDPPRQGISPFSVPDTPDMPSDHPGGGGSGLSPTTPDSPEMPSDEPDGGQYTIRNNSGRVDQAPSATSLWDKAFGWLRSLIENI